MHKIYIFNSSGDLILETEDTSKAIAITDSSPNLYLALEAELEEVIWYKSLPDLDPLSKTYLIRELESEFVPSHIRAKYLLLSS